MNNIGMTALLKTKVNNVWADFVPEGKPLPAVSFTHVANGADRILKGKKVGEWDTWRVIVQCKNSKDRDTTADLLKELDNTNSIHFKNVFVVSAGNLQAMPNDKLRNAYVDLRTYEV